MSLSTLKKTSTVAMASNKRKQLLENDVSITGKLNE
jgi:hypothetical protein